MQDTAAFGARLRGAILRRLGEDMEAEFARRIGMSPTQLSRVLNGKVGQRPEPETIQRYARGLGLVPRVVASWIDGADLIGLGEDGTESPPRGDREGEGEPSAMAVLIDMVAPGFDAETVAWVEEVYQQEGIEGLKRVAVQLQGPWRSNFEAIVGLVRRLEEERSARGHRGVAMQ